MIASVCSGKALSVSTLNWLPRARVSGLSPHARICETVLAPGVEKLAEGTRDEVVRYNFFSDELFGIEEPIARTCRVFQIGSAAAGSPQADPLLMGPVGGGKSTIVNMLKRGLETWTRTDNGAVYAIQDCPMHEEPLHLIPVELRPEIAKHYGVYIEGELCPQCRVQPRTPLHGQTRGRSGRADCCSRERTASVSGPSRPPIRRSQDITELTGSIDLSTIGELGVESDPRAYGSTAS